MKWINESPRKGKEASRWLEASYRLLSSYREGGMLFQPMFGGPANPRGRELWREFGERWGWRITRTTAEAVAEGAKALYSAILETVPDRSAVESQRP